MEILDIFALVVMAILLAMVIWLVVTLGTWPGKVAKKRDHPQADAIQVLSWIGIITLGIGWFVALVWAYTNPVGKHPADPALDDRIKALERQLEQLQAREDAS